MIPMMDCLKQDGLTEMTLNRAKIEINGITTLKYPIFIEDDDKVCYVYLLKAKRIVGDIWLYNNSERTGMAL